MNKIWLSIAIVISLILPGLAMVSFAADIKEEDVIFSEDFSEYKNTLSGNSAYFSVGTKNEAYLSVSAKAESNNEFPEITFNKLKGKITVSFDSKNEGSNGRIYFKFGSGVYKEILFNREMPILRNMAGAAYYMFKPSSGPSMSSWNNYKFEFDFDNSLVATYVNDILVDEYYDAYGETLPNYRIGALSLSGIKFGTDINKTTGNALYDNIQIFYTPEEIENPYENGEELDYNHYINLTKADFLGLLNEESRIWKMNREITRGEFARFAAIAAGIIPEADGKYFNDIEKSPYRDYITALCSGGAIAESADGNFYPDRIITLNEAIKTVCVILGYEPMAAAKGGWTDGYYLTASDIDLLEGVNAISGSQLMNFKDTIALVVNMVTTPMMTISLSSTIGNASYSVSEDETIIAERMNLKEVKGRITELNEYQLSLSSKDGFINKYSPDKSVSSQDIEGMYYKLWVNEDDEVVFAYPAKKEKVVYKYIYSYNNNETDGSTDVSSLKNIVLYGDDEKYKIDDEIVIKVNGTEISNFEPVGAFARIIIEENTILAMDIYCAEGTNKLAEGGMLSGKTDDLVTYLCGANELRNINKSSYDETVVVINGKKSDYSSLKPGMVFDYMIADNLLVMAASSFSCDGYIGSYSNEHIVLDDIEYLIGNFPVYISIDGGNNYDASNTLSSTLSKAVTIYCDAMGAVRYIVAPESSSFIGIVVSGGEYDEYDFEPCLKIAYSNGSEVVEAIYKVKDRKQGYYYPYVSFEDALANAKNPEGKGVYKFTVKKDTIVSIEELNWAVHEGEEIVSAMMFDYRGPRVQLNNKEFVNVSKDLIYVLKDYNGEFAPTVLQWNEVQDIEANFKMRYDIGEPLGNVIVITDGAETIIDDESYLSFISTKIERYIDDEVKTCYEFRGNGISELVLDEGVKITFAASELEENDYILYKTGGIYSETGGINISDKISLNGLIEQTGSGGRLELKNLGTLNGLVKNYLKTELNGEVIYTYLFTNNVYAANDSKTRFTESNFNNAVGYEVYAVLVDDLVRMLIYVED